MRRTFFTTAVALAGFGALVLAAMNGCGVCR